MAVSPSAVLKAAERLRGHVLCTPLIGDVQIAGKDVGTALRVKAECLQTGGGVAYRGAQHFLLRRLGSLKGLVLSGSNRDVLCWARAGAAHRLPMLVDQKREEIHEELQQNGCAVGADAGLCRVPGIEDPDFLAGVATLGLELAGQLPREIETVLVTERWTGPVELGLRAGGYDHAIRSVEFAAEPRENLRLSVRRGLRLDVDDEGLSVLDAALCWSASDGCCAILTC